MTPACSVWRRTNGRGRAMATTATYGASRRGLSDTGSSRQRGRGGRRRPPSQAADQQPRVRIIFAAAASQIGFLAGLAREPGVDWSRVEVFQMDGRSQANDASWPRRWTARRSPSSGCSSGRVACRRGPSISGFFYGLLSGETPEDALKLGWALPRQAPGAS